MSSLNDQFLYSVLIIALGYALKRFNIIKESDGEALSRIVFNITLPCLIITSFHDIKLDLSLIFLIIIAFVYGIFSAFLGVLAFKKEKRKIKGMMTMMVPGFNIGLFAYPLVEGIWGQEGLKYFGMFDMGNAFIVFGLTYLIGSYYSGDHVQLDIKHVLGKISRSIPLLAYIVTCTVSIIGLQLPSLVLDVSQIISKANTPLSLLLLGLYLNFSFEKGYFKRIGKYLVLRYVVGLSIGIVSFFVLPFDNMFRYTILIALILPTSVSALVYAIQFDYDKKLIGTVSNLTILISFVLLWGIGNILM